MSTGLSRALKPDGIFHLNEFVGPTRFQWTAIQLDLINSFLESLPDRLRQTPQGPQSPVQRPTIEQMIAMDPTEAIRSADIRDALGAKFEIIEDRPFGGTLLHLGLAGIAQNFDPANPEDVAHLERFFVLEDRMIANGAIGSDFAVLTAVPRGSRLASRQQSANVLPSVRNHTPSYHSGHILKRPLAGPCQLALTPTVQETAVLSASEVGGTLRPISAILQRLLTRFRNNRYKAWK